MKRYSSHQTQTVMIAYDATKELTMEALNTAIACVFQRGDIIQEGDTLVVFGILHRLDNPMGYQIQPSTSAFIGANTRALQDGVMKKVELYESMLQRRAAERCKEQGVTLEVIIAAGTPTKTVIVQVATTLRVNCLILDRHLRKDLKYYIDQVPCKIALLQESQAVFMEESNQTKNAETQLQLTVFTKNQLEQSVFMRRKRIFPSSNPPQDQENILLADGILSHQVQEVSDVPAFQHNISVSNLSLRTKGTSTTLGGVLQLDRNIEVPGSSSACREEISSVKTADFRYNLNMRSGSLSDFEISSSVGRHDSLEKTWPERLTICSACGHSSVLCSGESKKFSFAEIKAATNNFSRENILGEGGFGYVYRGKLADGQVVAIKQHKEASTQGEAEFNSEVNILSYARHRNIVMLLGYCIEKEQNILVYEYICNNSLAWHLSEKNTEILKWQERQAIAIGVAKGLRFLHEECRAGCIVHRDLRPSNILLTHEFTPMVGDFGLAKWKTNDDPTRVIGTLGYLAPEYAESGTVTNKTDVYSFGIVLLQLISGRKVVDFSKPEKEQSLIQWAEPLIAKLELHELMDPRLGESYDADELYRMVRTAFLCIQRNPSIRPSMGQVVRLLEGENEWIQELLQCLSP